jgi:hypothetical protein
MSLVDCELQNKSNTDTTSEAWQEVFLVAVPRRISSIVGFGHKDEASIQYGPRFLFARRGEPSTYLSTNRP